MLKTAIFVADFIILSKNVKKLNFISVQDFIVHFHFRENKHYTRTL